MNRPPHAGIAPTPADRTVQDAPPRPNELRVLWLIARRGALESLRDRLTLFMSLFFALALPPILVSTVVRGLVAGSAASGQDSALGGALAINLLTIGLLPATGAVGVAAGQFAGEKEQGNLAPLLASPASNIAIFGGKILGSILPALLFALVAETTYLVCLALIIGVETLRLLPLALALTMVALVPAVALFGATVSSLISSRVRTYNAAQQIGGLVLLPFWGLIFGLTLKLQDWGPQGSVAVVVGLFAVDLALATLAATTWRREEVLAHR